MENLKEKYVISLDGCDDTTYYIGEYTTEEYNFLLKVAEDVSSMSTHICMPTMSVWKFNQERDKYISWRIDTHLEEEMELEAIKNQKKYDL